MQGCNQHNEEEVGGCERYAAVEGVVGGAAVDGIGGCGAVVAGV